MNKQSTLTKHLAIVTLAAVAYLPVSVRAQSTPSKQEYLKRSAGAFKNVWQLYRVPSHAGLFSENYPQQGKADSLTYMQGGNIEPKEVSFLWPFSAMFSATNMLLKVSAERKQQLKYLDSLVIGVEKYRDEKRQPTGYQAYPVQFEKSDRYYDDNALVAIDYAEAYMNTKDQRYLKRAKEVFRFIQSGWDDKLGGGVYWLEGHKDQKPACTNGMSTLAALKIYKASNEQYYLDCGVKYYNWMKEHLRTPAGIYANDQKMDGKINHTYWTYNSGSMLEASVLLYQFTKKESYLTEAKAIAEGTLKHFGARSKSPQLPLHIDLPWFVTILFRGYEALYKVDGDYKYVAAVEKALNYAWANSRDKYGLVTHSWLPDAAELKKPKSLLDEGCIAELYARLALLKTNN